MGKGYYIISITILFAIFSIEISCSKTTTNNPKGKKVQEKKKIQTNSPSLFYCKNQFSNSPPSLKNIPKNISSNDLFIKHQIINMENFFPLKHDVFLFKMMKINHLILLISWMTGNKTCQIDSFHHWNIERIKKLAPLITQNDLIALSQNDPNLCHFLGMIYNFLDPKIFANIPSDFHFNPSYSSQKLSSSSSNLENGNFKSCLVQIASSARLLNPHLDIEEFPMIFHSILADNLAQTISELSLKIGGNNGNDDLSFMIDPINHNKLIVTKVSINDKINSSLNSLPFKIGISPLLLRYFRNNPIGKFFIIKNEIEIYIPIKIVLDKSQTNEYECSISPSLSKYIKIGSVITIKSQNIGDCESITTSPIKIDNSFFNENENNKSQNQDGNQDDKDENNFPFVFVGMPMENNKSKDENQDENENGKDENERSNVIVTNLSSFKDSNASPYPVCKKTEKNIKFLTGPAKYSISKVIGLDDIFKSVINPILSALAFRKNGKRAPMGFILDGPDNVDFFQYLKEIFSILPGNIKVIDIWDESNNPTLKEGESQKIIYYFSPKSCQGSEGDSSILCDESIWLDMFSREKDSPFIILTPLSFVSIIPEWMLNNPDYFASKLELNLPTLEARKLILTHRNLPNQNEIADQLKGFSTPVIHDICIKAIRENQTDLESFLKLIKSSIEIDGDNDNDKQIQSSTSPSSSLFKSLESKNLKFKLDWSDIQGLDSIKKDLQESIFDPYNYPHLALRFNVVPSKGVLFYGPPGCGKTMIAKALSKKSGLAFHSVTISELLDASTGGPAENIRYEFEKARKSSPSILFIDEFEVLAPSRTNNKECSSSPSNPEAITTLLAEMDGAQSENSTVIVIAATNRPDTIDSAILRPGRFDQHIYISPPDANGRREILKHELLKMNNKIFPSPLNNKIKGIHLEELWEIADGLVNRSAADIKNIVKDAAEIAIKRFMKKHDIRTEKEKKPVIIMKDIIEAASRSRKSISVEDARYYENYNASRKSKVSP